MYEVLQNYTVDDYIESFQDDIYEHAGLIVNLPPLFNETTTYQKEDMVVISYATELIPNYIFFASNIDDNTNNPPMTHADEWRQIGSCKKTKCINKQKIEEILNYLKTTANQAKSVIDKCFFKIHCKDREMMVGYYQYIINLYISWHLSKMFAGSKDSKYFNLYQSASIDAESKTRLLPDDLTKLGTVEWAFDYYGALIHDEIMKHRRRAYQVLNNVASDFYGTDI